MTKVKICGITSKTEIVFINRYLPDYIGFVFAESKRRVTPEKAAELAAGLSPAIKKVGVFVDIEPEKSAEIAALAGLDALQLHGQEDARYIEALRRLLKPGTEIWKSIRMGGYKGSEAGVVGGNEASNGLNLNGALLPESQCDNRKRKNECPEHKDECPEHKDECPEHKDELPESYHADRLILDTYAVNCLGGTGRTFDWGLAQQIRKKTQLPFILAGGLHPSNVRQAIEQVSPFAVDTSSGVEGDGIKDEEKVRNFIEAVRGESR